MIHAQVRDLLERSLSDKTGTEVRILDLQSVGGGCINDCYRVESSAGRFFLKVNSDTRFPGMFKAEAKGLELLGDHSEFAVPKPIIVESSGVQQFLLMEWLESGDAGLDFDQQFGRKLAELHKASQSKFGLDHSNYIGSLSQSNTAHSTWAEFLWLERLLPQIKLASSSRLMTRAMISGFDLLENRLHSIYPEEQPSLIHGDLWSGNYGISEDGNPMIFDPAVYYGHREMDLAMMKLFGGFSASIFESYHESFPLENGWNERIPIGQLYPLMVHVNLFGSSYCAQVERILSRL